MFGKRSKQRAVAARLIARSADFALEGLEARQLLTVPLNPTGLAVASATSSSLNLVWQDNANNETGFVVERLINGNWGTIANLGVNATVYTDTGLAASTSYAYRVHAVNASGGSAYSFIGSAVTAAVSAPPTAPAAPSGLQSNSPSSSQITLNWTDASSNETGFNIERLNGASWSVVGTVGANTTTYTDNGLTPSTAYTYRVDAVNATGNSPYTNNATTSTQAVGTATNPPLAPFYLSATINGSSQVSLIWGDKGDLQTGVTVERQAGNGTFAAVATLAPHTTSYVDTTAAGSTFYTYRIAAFNSAGQSPYSNTSSVITPAGAPPAPTAPAAPTNLGTTANSASQITLNWTDTSNNETGFNVERWNGATWSVIASLPANTTSYANTGLAASTAYSYRVTATNAAGSSAYTNTSTATTQASVPATNPPLAPYFLSASASASGVSLGWFDNTGIETGVNIERQTGNGAFAVIATIAAHSQSYVDTTAAGSTFYSYRVAAVNSAGNSPYSNISSVITPVGAAPAPTAPTAPTSLGATANSASQITLNWTDTSNNETGFNVERLNGATWSVIASLPANTSTYANTGLTASTVYSYRVTATNAVGASAYTNTATATTQAAVVGPSAPSAPTNLNTNPDLSTQITLTWTDTSNNETGFSIERLVGSTWTPIQTVAANTTTYSDANLTPLTSYSYRVSAVNASGVSAYTNISTATTPATVAANAPAAPSLFSAVPISSTKLSLTWTDNANNETGFNVERWNGAAWVVIATLPANSTYYNDAGLTASMPYTYRVDAVNASGPSAYSNNSTAATTALNAPPPPRTDLSTFFPIGVFQQPQYAMSTWKSRGVNTMVGYESYGNLSTMAEWTQLANDNGLKYMRQPSANPASDINDPNLISWLYPLDEPDLSTIDVAQPLAQAEFNQLRSIDPSRPIATTYAGGYMLNWIQGVRDQAYYNTMVQYTDWVMPCIYPVTGWNQPGSLNAVGQLVDRVNQWFPGKRNIAYIETSNQNLSWVGSQERGVTPGEYRAEVWDAVIHGATGIVYFPHSLSPFNYDATPADVAAEMTVQDARLSKYGAALLTAQNPAGTSLSANGTIETAWRVYNGHTYYFALNLSPNAVSNVSMSTTGLSPSKTLSVDGENRTVTLQGTNLVDSFQPYEAHVYVV